MTQELGSQAGPFVSPFYETGDICHHKGLTPIRVNDTEIWYQGREGIGSNFWPCCGYLADKSGFAGIGEADETDIGDKLELF